MTMFLSTNILITERISWKSGHGLSQARKVREKGAQYIEPAGAAEDNSFFLISDGMPWTE